MSLYNREYIYFLTSVAQQEQIFYVLSKAVSRLYKDLCFGISVVFSSFAV